MARSGMPDTYIGREQAYIKHTILKAYLARLFMIIGQGKEPVINYVDCFAGPWQEEDKALRDTSIGISLEQMASCQQGLRERFGGNVRFRALYIEEDIAAFDKLQAFLARQPNPDIDTTCLHGDYTTLLGDIVAWCGGYFTFFFIDPKGWRKVVSAETMEPLLQLPKSEFLINLMYDFINRFVGVDRHADDMSALFGEVPDLDDGTPEDRQRILLKRYRGELKKYYQGRSACVPIMRPGHDRVLYYLVYLTRHPRGIDVFKTEAQKMEIVQRITQQECRLRKQIEQDGTADMFADDAGLPPQDQMPGDNRLEARACLLPRLSEGPLMIDYDVWADLLEDSDLYPADFQEAMKQLVEEGLVQNLDADVSRRRTKIIRPRRAGRSERWVRNPKSG